MVTQRKLHKTADTRAAERQEMCTVENGEEERKNTRAMTPETKNNALTCTFPP
jgi:hypothetical protein